MNSTLLSLNREGSVIANFTINYASMDKEQFLFFQDILETSHAVGKMELVTGVNMSLAIGPDRKFKKDLLLNCIEFFYNLLSYVISDIMEENIRFGKGDSLRKSNVFSHNGEDYVT